jgi:hypothetical protein
MTTATDISAYLEIIARADEHWLWGYRDPQGYWSVEYNAITPPCKLNLSLDMEFLCVEAAVGPVRCRPDCRAALHYYLLRLNDELPIVKFGLDAEKEAKIVAEAPAAKLSLEAFEILLRLVTAVFEQYRLEIELLAGEHELADLVLRPLSASEGKSTTVRVLGGDL